MVPKPKDEHENIIVNGNKEKDVGFMVSYISMNIFFHVSGINNPRQVWKKLKTLFDKFDKSWVIQIEKEFICLNHIPFSQD